MHKTLTIILLSFLTLGCEKDKTIPLCSGVSMTNERALFVGTWHWYGTTIEEWFDVGVSNYYEYTPQSEGFDYYFTISENGILKGYRDSVLQHDFKLSKIEHENFSGSTTNVMQFNINCSSYSLELFKFVSVVTNDTIHTSKLPLNFVDNANHLRSHRNHFVRE